MVRAAMQETPMLRCSGFDSDHLTAAASTASPLCIGVGVGGEATLAQSSSAGYPMRGAGGVCLMPRLLSSASAAPQRCGNESKPAKRFGTCFSGSEATAGVADMEGDQPRMCQLCKFAEAPSGAHS